MGNAILNLLILLALAFPARAAEFISPDEITPGMKGYGLTVFQGTDPESFAVEAVGVLKNKFPRQDLVIIFMDDPKLEMSNVTAGMSGSPIYFNGKLLGALAYGPTFSKKPIAYVTPIQNMLQELDRPAEPDRPWQRAAGFEDISAPDGSSPLRRRPEGTTGTMKPVSSTLAVSGFSAERMALLEKWFSPHGLIPVASGGADLAADGPAAFVPGAAVGVQLMSGDLAMTAIGTVTHVDAGGRVLAFGHPFFNIGQTSMPATTARVHTFMPSTYISYKLASPIKPLGSMVQDRQPAIVIDPTRPAWMVPVDVRVENAVTGRNETYRYRVIREQRLTPILAFIGFAEAVDVSEASPLGDRAYDVKSTIRLVGRDAPVVLSDVTPNPYKTLFDMMMLLDNPIQEAVPAGFEFDVKVTNASRIAWITSVRTAARQFRPADRVAVTVRLRDQHGQEFEREAGFTLPASITGRMATLEIRGGFGFSQPEARPVSLDQIVRLIEKRPNGTDLIVRLMQASPAYAQNGTALSNLPVFFQKILQGGVQGVSQPVAQMPYERHPTDHIILGSQQVQIEIVPEGRPR